MPPSSVRHENSRNNPLGYYLLQTNEKLIRFPVKAILKRFHLNDHNTGLHDAVPGRGGAVLPSSRLMRMCRWMGSHFHDWIDYYGVASV